MKVLKEITAVRSMDLMKARLRPRKPTADDHYREASRHYMARTDTHNGEVRKAIAKQNLILQDIADAIIGAEK